MKDLQVKALNECSVTDEEIHPDMSKYRTLHPDNLKKHHFFHDWQGTYSLLNTTCM